MCLASTILPGSHGASGCCVHTNIGGMVSNLQTFVETIPFTFSVGCCGSGAARVQFSQVNLPAGPPGPVPAMDASVDRMRFLDGIAPDGTVFAFMKLHNCFNHC